MQPCEILVIDDDIDDVELLSEAFTEIGFNCVDYVSSAREALSYLDKTQPEHLPKLIVTDLVLPGTTGAMFIQGLRTEPKYKHIPVMILSTVEPDTGLQDYSQVDALGYLVKPTNFKQYLKVAEIIKEKAGLVQV